MGLRVSNVLFSGQDRRAITFNVAAGTVVGDAVTITANGTVGRGANGNPFYGVLESLDADGKGTVQRAGLVDVAHTGVMVAGPQVVLTVNGTGAVVVKGAPAAGDRGLSVVAFDNTALRTIVDLG